MESIAKSSLESKILDLCERHLGPQGFRAVDVDAHMGGRSMVRIFVERQAGEATPKTSLEDCATASRLIGEVLDTENVLSGAYDLEVSSPGLDRRLRVREDFEKVIGQEIKAKLTESLEGKGANLTGTVETVQGDAVVMKVSGEERRVPLEKIKRANVVWHF